MKSESFSARSDLKAALELAMEAMEKLKDVTDAETQGFTFYASDLEFATHLFTVVHELAMELTGECEDAPGYEAMRSRLLEIVGRLPGPPLNTGKPMLPFLRANWSPYVEDRKEARALLKT